MSQSDDIRYGETRARTELAQLRAALQNIAALGSVNLAAEWEHGLRDIIRAMTDCAKGALEQSLPPQEDRIDRTDMTTPCDAPLRRRR